MSLLSLQLPNLIPILIGLVCAFAAGWIIRHLLAPTCGTTSRKSKCTDPTLRERDEHEWFRLNGRLMRATKGQLAELAKAAENNQRDNPF